MDDFNVHNENTVPSPRKKSHKTFWTLLLAAVIALACGYLGSYLANSQTEEKVVIQKVATPDAEDSITPAVEVAKAISPTVVSITTEKRLIGRKSGRFAENQP